MTDGNGGSPIYDDRKYEYLFIGGRHDFMSGDALWIDARTLFHYEAIVVTPAMKTKRESRFRGTSSQHHTGD
jgi:hypothetical protein